MAFNVIVATPSSGQCRTSFAYSLARMVAHFAQVRVHPECEDQRFDFLLVEGSGISSNREKMVRMALENKEMTHLLWIDDDMGFEKDVLHILAARRQPVVGCNYRMRVPPADFTAVRKDEKGRVQTHAASTGLEEAAYTGFGFCLIERRVLEAVPQPRFPIHFIEAIGDYTTEDNPFFAAVAKVGIPCFVDHDASKKIWHSGSINYVWNQDFTSHAMGTTPAGKTQEKTA